MKIQDLLLKEVMNGDGFPIHQLSLNSWSISIPSESTKNNNKDISVVVNTPSRVIDEYNVTELSFRLVGTNQIQLEDVFKNTEVFKLFTSLRMIIDQGSADIIVAIPNDINIDIGNKKAQVYMAVLNRMLTRGLLARIEKIDDPSGNQFLFALPTASRAVLIDQNELIDIATKYFAEKN
jgi:hypothetical protein